MSFTQFAGFELNQEKAVDGEVEEIEFCIFQPEEGSVTTSMPPMAQSASRSYVSTTASQSNSTSYVAQHNAGGRRLPPKANAPPRMPPPPAIRGAPMPDFVTPELLRDLSRMTLPVSLKRKTIAVVASS